jgi:hypothetical protein
MILRQVESFPRRVCRSKSSDFMWDSRVAQSVWHQCIRLQHSLSLPSYLNLSSSLFHLPSYHHLLSSSSWRSHLLPLFLSSDDQHDSDNDRHHLHSHDYAWAQANDVRRLDPPSYSSLVVWLVARGTLQPALRPSPAHPPAHEIARMASQAMARMRRPLLTRSGPSEARADCQRLAVSSPSFRSSTTRKMNSRADHQVRTAHTYVYLIHALGHPKFDLCSKPDNIESHSLPSRS